MLTLDGCLHGQTGVGCAHETFELEAAAGRRTRIGPDSPIRRKTGRPGLTIGAAIAAKFSVAAAAVTSREPQSREA